MQGAPSSLQSAMCITAAEYSTMQEALATIAGAALFKESTPFWGDSKPNMSLFYAAPDSASSEDSNRG